MITTCVVILTNNVVSNQHQWKVHRGTTHTTVRIASLETVVPMRGDFTTRFGAFPIYYPENLAQLETVGRHHCRGDYYTASGCLVRYILTGL